jgi:hypothetical protein
LPSALDSAAVGGAAFLDVNRFGVLKLSAVAGSQTAVDFDQGLVVAKVKGQRRLDFGTGIAQPGPRVGHLPAIDAVWLDPDIDLRTEPPGLCGPAVAKTASQDFTGQRGPPVRAAAGGVSEPGSLLRRIPEETNRIRVRRDREKIVFDP